MSDTGSVAVGNQLSRPTEAGREVALEFKNVDPHIFEILTGMAIADRYIGASDSLGVVTFPPSAVAAQVGCHECGGSGWWGYGPTPSTCGPCVVCKGTGREWIGL